MAKIWGLHALFLGRGGGMGFGEQQHPVETQSICGYSKCPMCQCLINWDSLTTLVNHLIT